MFVKDSLVCSFVKITALTQTDKKKHAYCTEDFLFIQESYIVFKLTV